MSASVEFHTGVADPIGFACRLLRKAFKQGVRVVVRGSPGTLDALDQALWTFSAQDFLPHARVPGASAQVVARTPIWLLSGPLPDVAPRVLVNLDAEPPDQGASLERIIEIVGTSDDAVAAGRSHWRHYEAWGVQPVHHRAS